MEHVRKNLWLLRHHTGVSATACMPLHRAQLPPQTAMASKQEF